MNILITGGLGYIGGRMANHIRDKHPESRVYLTNLSVEGPLPDWAAKFTVLPMNLLDEKSIYNCLAGRNIDVIIHLAALNEIDSMKDPEAALRVNTLGTYKLLDLASREKVGAFIYFSTFHVYGETSGLVITEDSPTRPAHPYALTHRAAEDLVNYFQRYHNMKTLIFRLSNGYGYPMDKNVERWTLVFNDLCRQAVAYGRMELKSSGKQARDFISLFDVARAIEHFLFTVPEKWGDGLYNLGGNCSLSILSVAEKIAAVYKEKYKKSLIEIKTGLDNGAQVSPAAVRYSIDKIIRTGFILQGDMKSEIEKTLTVCEGFKK